MHKILIPTDFSPCAAYASQAAAIIAKATGAEIYLIHVIDAPVDWVKLPKEKEANYPETKAKIVKAKQQFESIKNSLEFEGLAVHHMLAYNIAYEDIIQYANSIEADLIVMGTHGSSGFNEYFIGSTTQKVVRLAKQPVLTLKYSKREFKTEKMVFASSFEGDLTVPFQKIQDFAEAMGSEIHLLFVNTPGKFKDTLQINSLMAAFASAQKIESAKLHIFNALNIEKGIQDFSQSLDVDLVSVITRRSNKLFGSYFSESLANHLSIPVLSLNHLG
jgi:nucleotide-binding universal stress UspA family protein